MSNTTLLQSFISDDTLLKVQTFYNSTSKDWETHSTYKGKTLLQTYKTKKLHFKRIEYYIKIYSLNEIIKN